MTTQKSTIEATPETQISETPTPVIKTSEIKTTETKGLQFADMGISAPLLKVLQGMKIEIPTPIQSQSIPKGLEGLDILGIAQTGTGKTLAFGIPVLQNMAKNGGKTLILLPTRELAQQVNESLAPLCRAIGARSAVLIGGVAMHGQIRDLRANPKIIIATPGRLADVMRQGYVKLNDVAYLVLDEADRMLDMGFAPQIAEILKHVPKTRQTLLFSATMPESILKLAREYMNKPVRVEVAPAGTGASNIEHGVYLVKRDQKPLLLQKLVSEMEGTMIVFTRTKFAAKRLNEMLRDCGVLSAEIHSNRSQAQRRDALQGFKSGRNPVLIATDIAARGIDVANIGIVVNYDLPENAEDYVHRSGRTGRAGKSGVSVSFAEPSQKRALRYIEQLIRKHLVLYDMPNLKDIIFKNVKPKSERTFDTANFESRPRRDFDSRSSRPSSRFSDDRRSDSRRPSSRRDESPRRDEAPRYEARRDEAPRRDSRSNYDARPARPTTFDDRSAGKKTFVATDRAAAPKEKPAGYLSDSKPFQKKATKSEKPATAWVPTMTESKKHRKGRPPVQPFAS